MVGVGGVAYAGCPLPGVSGTGGSNLARSNLNQPLINNNSTTPETLKVDRNRRLVHRAPARGKEDVLDDGHGERSHVHAKRALWSIFS